MGVSFAKLSYYLVAGAVAGTGAAGFGLATGAGVGAEALAVFDGRDRSALFFFFLVCKRFFLAVFDALCIFFCANAVGSPKIKGEATKAKKQIASRTFFINCLLSESILSEGSPENEAFI
jgi:hypothetical protein